MKTKRAFLNTLYDGTVCRLVLDHLNRQALTFDEIYDDPRQLDYKSGVPGFIRTEDVMGFAQRHGFELQATANEVHHERGESSSLPVDREDYASYLVSFAIKLLREEIEAFKEDR